MESSKVHSKNNVEILCIGTELLLGNIINSNSQWLAEELAGLGLNHYKQTVVGDNLTRLKKSIIESADRCKILITTGGLGPTPDDITTEALAQVFNTPLKEDKKLLEEIQFKLNRKGHLTTSNNRKQAQIPIGAKVIPNPNGTAPGIIWSPIPGFTVLTFPGVPSEMKRMWKDTAAPWLRKNGGSKNIFHSKILRFAGVRESALAEQIKDLLYQKNPTIAPYAYLGEVKLRLTACAASIKEAHELLHPLERDLKTRTGLLCYGSNEDTLASVVINLLHQRNEFLAIAESCTGGGLSAAITAIPNASKVFKGGLITYSNEMKNTYLGVPNDLMQKHGSVSKEVVIAMAQGAKQKLQTDWSIAVSGIAGPGGGSTTKPVGLVHFAIAGPSGCSSFHENFSPYRSRVDIQKLSVMHALNLLRLQMICRS